MTELDELREATRHRAYISEVVPTSPRAPGWDHARKCMDREAAEHAREQLRQKIGVEIGGRKVRWKVGACVVCHKWFVRADGSSNGDVAGQRRRRRARKRELARARKTETP